MEQEEEGTRLVLLPEDIVAIETVVPGGGSERERGFGNKRHAEQGWLVGREQSVEFDFSARNSGISLVLLLSANATKNRRFPRDR